MSLAHLLWSSTGSADRPMILVLRLSNSDFSLAMAPSSVVQTGVKSLGCENRIAHLSPIHLWKSMGPSVVCAWELGASSPIRNAMEFSLRKEKNSTPRDPSPPQGLCSTVGAICLAPKQNAAQPAAEPERQRRGRRAVLRRLQDAARGAARGPLPYRHQARLRAGRVRRLCRADRRRAAAFLPC